MHSTSTQVLTRGHAFLHTDLHMWHHIVHVAPFQHHPIQMGSLRAALTGTLLCLTGPPACYHKPVMWYLFERNTDANMHLHPTYLLFAVPFESLFLCLASHSTSSMPLKHRSRWFAGQFRRMVPFSASGSLQLLRSGLSVSEMKILLAHPHILCHSQHL